MASWFCLHGGVPCTSKRNTAARRSPIHESKLQNSDLDGDQSCLDVSEGEGSSVYSAYHGGWEAGWTWERGKLRRIGSQLGNPVRQNHLVLETGRQRVLLGSAGGSCQEALPLIAIPVPSGLPPAPLLPCCSREIVAIPKAWRERKGWVREGRGRTIPIYCKEKRLLFWSSVSSCLAPNEKGVDSDKKSLHILLQLPDK